MHGEPAAPPTYPAPPGQSARTSVLGCRGIGWAASACQRPHAQPCAHLCHFGYASAGTARRAVTVKCHADRRPEFRDASTSLAQPLEQPGVRERTEFLDASIVSGMGFMSDWYPFRVVHGPPLREDGEWSDGHQE